MVSSPSRALSRGVRTADESHVPRLAEHRRAEGGGGDVAVFVLPSRHAVPPARDRGVRSRRRRLARRRRLGDGAPPKRLGEVGFLFAPPQRFVQLRGVRVVAAVSGATAARGRARRERNARKVTTRFVRASRSVSRSASRSAGNRRARRVKGRASVDGDARVARLVPPRIASAVPRRRSRRGLQRGGRHQHRLALARGSLVVLRREMGGVEEGARSLPMTRAVLADPGPTRRGRRRLRRARAERGSEVRLLLLDARRERGRRRTRARRESASDVSRSDETNCVGRRRADSGRF